MAEVPSHPVVAEEQQPKGVLGKVKEVLGLGGGSPQPSESVQASASERVHEEATSSGGAAAGPSTPSRAGPVCAPSEVRAGGGRPRGGGGRGEAAAAVRRLHQRRPRGQLPAATWRPATR